MSDFRGDRKRAAAQRLLAWNDLAVIEDAAALLILERNVASMAVVCEALAIQDTEEDLQASETILWELSPAWKSGAVDVPTLLKSVSENGSAHAKRGAEIALEWLGIDSA